MGKYISTPVVWALYEVEDEAVQLLSSAVATQPPQIVLELMALNGHARKIGQVGAIMSIDSDEDEEEDTSEESDGSGPWLSDEET